MLATILLIVSIGAFILGRVASDKSKSILVSHNITVDEEQIKALGLYVGLALRLSCAEEKDVINVWVADASGREVLLGTFTSYIEYDILRKKNIKAFVYGISGDIVVVEVKLHDAL